MLFTLEQRSMRSIGKVFVPHFLVSIADFGVGVLAAGRTGERSGCLRRRVSFGLLRSHRDNQAASHKECQHE